VFRPRLETSQPAGYADADGAPSNTDPMGWGRDLSELVDAIWDNSAR
jgi:hypothetical protein